MEDPVKRKKDLATLAALAAALLVFYFIFRKTALLCIALVILAAGALSGKAASFLADSWLRFSGFVADFNTRLILRVIYYAILTPVAFFFRLAHPDHLKTVKDASAKSYFTERTHLFTPSDFEKMW